MEHSRGWYQNTGTSWARPSGGVVARGEIFQATAFEESIFALRRGRGRYRFLVPVPAPTPITEEVGGVKVVLAFGTDGEGVPEWPLKLTPERYLELHPEGPNAELARQILRDS